jgi:hypothetical protein
MAKQAEVIKKSIKELEKELDSIQSECNHPEYIIKNCPTQSTTFQLRRVCTKCTKEIGYPSQEEINNWSSS